MDSTNLLIFIVLLLILGLSKALLRPRKSKIRKETFSKEMPPKEITQREIISDDSYQKIPTLFSPAERSFYGVLESVLTDNFVLLGKVRVADVIKPKQGFSKKEWGSLFNKISRKHFDFVVCDKEYLTVICTVELNDSSHDNADRENRDKFLADAMYSAGVPLVFITAKRNYVASEVRSAIEPYLKKIQNHSEFEPLIKLCPKCSSPLIERTSKKAEHKGEMFLGCSAFPKCRFIDKSKETNAEGI
ncbi:DUF2726 domain-containing protein [Photobacterium profundum]|uniref:DUF2726 domain-containing protein n=1 Tax=Photobacterium profundum TaxID=74109 RepID=UPI003D0C0F19